MADSINECDMRHRYWLAYSLGIVLLGILNLTSCIHDAQPQQEPVIISVDLSSSRLLNHNAFGFNINQFNGVYAVTDPDFIQLSAELAPFLLRFPGGYNSNFYHWQDSGYRAEEMTLSLNPKLNQRNVGNYKALMRYRQGRESFDDFMAYCQALSIRPLIVVNLYTGSPAESAAWVRHALTQGYQIEAWELGNELYLPWYQNRVPSIEHYIEQAQAHAAAMRAVDPSIQLIANASPYGFHQRNAKGQLERGKEWDQKLATATFFDGYSAHFYTYDRSQRIHTFEQARDYFFGSSDIAFRESADYYTGLFPQHKAWITEWNISNPKNPYLNSQLHGLYCGDFGLNLIEYSDWIASSNYHVLSSGNRGFGTFSPQRTHLPRDGWMDPSQRQSIKRACFPTFKLLSSPLAEATHRAETQITHNPSFQSILEFHKDMLPAIKAVAVFNQTHLYILISNRYSTSLQVQIQTSPQPTTHHLEYDYIANANLAASNGGPANQPEHEKQSIDIQHHNLTGSGLLIPANSFGVVKMDVIS